MPENKALAVMTARHTLALTSAIQDARFDHDLLRDIESVVRYLVDHPERLAGEDEVVVKRKELDALVPLIREPYRTRAREIMQGWLAGSPTAQEGKEK